MNSSLAKVMHDSLTINISLIEVNICFLCPDFCFLFIIIRFAVFEKYNKFWVKFQTASVNNGCHKCFRIVK